MHRRSFIFGLIVAVGFAFTARAATPPEKTAKVEAEKMWRAFLEADLATFARYTHPTVVRMNGGERKLIDRLKQGFGPPEQL